MSKAVREAQNAKKRVRITPKPAEYPARKTTKPPTLDLEPQPVPDPEPLPPTPSLEPDLAPVNLEPTKETPTASEGITVSQHLESWLAVKSSSLGKHALVDYTRLSKRVIAPVLGEVRLIDLDASHGAMLEARWSSTPSQWLYAARVLNQALEAAVKDGMLERNPLRRERERRTRG